MTTLDIAVPVADRRSPSVLYRLTWLEMRSYARRPLFLVGVLVTIAVCLIKPDHYTSSFFNPIAPAAGLGVLGLVVMAGQTRSADIFQQSAGAAPVPERTQTAALALTCLLPFAVGVAWFIDAVIVYHRSPPAAGGFPFDSRSESWKWGLLFGMGAMSSLGGPLLGILLGRWWPRRGAAPLAAVLLVAAVIVMQGIFTPLRRVRVIMPFTNWGGPYGNPQHYEIHTGSPQWWVAYLVSLCGLAVVAALWHDPTARTTRLRRIAGALAAAAVAFCVLAMFTGVHHTLINPIVS